MSKKTCQEDKPWRYIGVVPQKNIIDVVYTSFKPACHIKRLSKDLYMKGRWTAAGEFISTGEVFEIQKKEVAMRNRRSLKRIFRDLRQLIANNCSGGLNELFVTLTYAVPTSDPQQIKRDWDAFWKRIKRAYVEMGLEYIAVVEPHASGNFHIHALLQARASEHLYIPNDVMARLWGHGFTKTERLEDVDHVGAYVIAYMTNAEIPPEKIEQYKKEGDVEERGGKAFIKGARLDFYPDGMQISRHSRGMVRPDRISEERAAYNAAAWLEKHAKTTFSCVSDISTKDDEGNAVELTVKKVQYRKSEDELPW